MRKRGKGSARRAAVSDPLYSFHFRLADEAHETFTETSECISFPGGLEEGLSFFRRYIAKCDESDNAPESGDTFLMFEVGRFPRGADAPVFHRWPILVARVVACSDPDCLSHHVDGAGQALH